MHIPKLILRISTLLITKRRQIGNRRPNRCSKKRSRDFKTALKFVLETLKIKKHNPSKNLESETLLNKADFFAVDLMYLTVMPKALLYWCKNYLTDVIYSIFIYCAVLRFWVVQLNKFAVQFNVDQLIAGDFATSTTVGPSTQKNWRTLTKRGELRIK
jgi:hypothetical protein